VRACVHLCAYVHTCIQYRKRQQVQADTLQHSATHCNTLQHIATHGNMLQHAATHFNTLPASLRRHVATHGNMLQHTSTHCNTLQHTATHYNKYTARTLHEHCTNTARTLHEHCTNTARTLSSCSRRQNPPELECLLACDPCAVCAANLWSVTHVCTCHDFICDSYKVCTSNE